MNSLPPGAPGSAAHDLDALGTGFSNAFLICGIAAALTAVGMIGVRPHRSPDAQPPADYSSTERDVAPQPAVK